MRIDVCKYYKGSFRCEKQHSVGDLALPNSKEIYILNKIPCIKRNNNNVCQDREFPSKVEVDEFEREAKEKLEKVEGCLNTVRTLINQKHGNFKKDGKTANGAMDCLFCGSKGTMLYRRAGYNGHIAINARCCNTFFTE